MKPPIPRFRAGVRRVTSTSNPPHRWAVWLSTGLGAGHLPKMPGTYGAIEGVALFLALHSLCSDAGTGLAIAGICLVSVWITALALPHFSSGDPQVIVIDEVAGQLVTLAAVLLWPTEASWTWYHVLAGFILFRLFDIVKPGPIRSLDRLPGAWGVVADDIGAGVAGGVILLAWGYLAR